MSGEIDDVKLQKFHEAVQTMKLYRRADIENQKGESLIDKLYVDPLPHNHVLTLTQKPSTTFLIGRKGSGKSTILQALQHSLAQNRRVASAYVDIKTVFESSQVEPKLLEKAISQNNALSADSVRELLLMRTFVREIVKGIRADLSKQFVTSYRARFREAFTGNITELFRGLDNFLAKIDQSKFLDVTSLVSTTIEAKEGQESKGSLKGDLKVDPKGISVGLGGSTELSNSIGSRVEYSAVMLRDFNIKELINGLRKVLDTIGVKHLYLLIDDFSELPENAMRAVVDTLLAPLNNWSDELVKLKITSYPGRIYYGAIDKSKIDEIDLDFSELYGRETIAEMEGKGIEFTRRLVETRFSYFGLNFSDFISGRSTQELVWKNLFLASMGNPRTLGYLLFFLYEMRLLYDHPITIRSIRDAARKFYEEKIESYFTIGKFLHESFDERSSIYSLKELLERIVAQAKKLRNFSEPVLERARKSRPGRPPTSHFYVPESLEGLLSTLELNFFISRYYTMSDRDGNRVVIYALNYGLCQKYSIEFGRLEGRQDRAYLVDRSFDYGPILQDYLATNEEIKCANCDHIFDHSELSGLRRFKMRCPECEVGICYVTNMSQKYGALLAEIDQASLLPPTELGILQTLNDNESPAYASEIAGELDCSPQLVGQRGRKLAQRELVERERVRSVYQYTATELARRIYFSDRDRDGLDVDDEGSSG